MMTLDDVPGRVFLDLSTLQSLQDYGEYIYDGGDISRENRIWLIPNGINNIEALRKIMLIGSRGSLQLVLSRNSLQEVMDRMNYDYLQWALEMLEYWENCLASYEDQSSAFTGHGVALSEKLREN